MLTVAASGDHIINAFYKGAKTVIGFDINYLALIFTELKLVALENLDYKEFLQFFMINDEDDIEKNKNVLNYAIYINKLRKYLLKSTAENWDILYQNFNNNGYDLRNSYIFNNKYDNNGLKINSNLYLKNEVEVFMNLCSTLFRLHTGIVYMIANKISRVCPYFSEWSLRGIPKLKEGQIDDYIFQDSQGTEVKICVEMCASPKHKKSGMFFGRIGKNIDTSAWSSKEYPHLQGDYADYDILYALSLEHLDFKFNIMLLQHKIEDFLCVYIYPSKMKISDRLITEEYSTDFLKSPCLNARNKAEVLINELVNNNKLVFPSNLIGEDFYSTIKNMKKYPLSLY